MNDAGLILLTRPIEDSRTLAQDLRALGYSPMVAPLLEIDYIPADLSDLRQFDGLVFTSVNAVRAASDYLADYDGVVYTVGPKTAQMVEGYAQNVRCGDGDVDSLRRLLERDAAGQSLLYLRGQDITRDLSHLKDVDCAERLVYKAKILNSFQKEVLKAFEEEKIQAISVFSKRTSQALCDVIKRHKLQKSLTKIKLLSISEDVLKCVHSYEWLESYSAVAPNGESMIALVRETCKPS